MYCPNCGAELENDAQECPVCGYQLDDEYEHNDFSDINDEKMCPVCGTILEKEDTVCPVCGMEIEPSTIKNNQTEPVLPKEPLKKKSSSNNKKRMLCIIIVIICLSAVIIILFAFKDKLFAIKENEPKTKSIEKTVDIDKKESPKDTDSNITKTEEPDNVVDATVYQGYCNIKGNQDRELTIQSITNKTVTFSLWYYRLDAVGNISATLDGNKADFMSDVDGLTFKGTLTFENDTISVSITESERLYMPIETMKFEEKHATSWELANDYADTYNSTDNDSVNDSEYDYNSSDSYILSDSSSRELTIADISGLSHDQLELARNEIYARHGRKFTNPTLQNYFDSQAWYTGTIEPEDFTDDMLSDIEKSNIQFIKDHE